MPPTASFTRRRFLSSTGLFVLIASAPGARAAEHSGTLPWKPFAAGLPTHGYQGAEAPVARYKAGLAALNKHTQSQFAGKNFFDLAAAEQDQVLKDFEAGKVEYKPAAGFFNLVLQNTMEGFFADPIYGGNKDMAGWKFIGFPGARYDYRDYITAHNKPFPLPPLSIAGRPEWKTGDKTSGN
jgi:gluconate 2-dehydrogenase gamma chain